ncbi:hypothetical protein BCR32DRAFT_324940 [Anaeromyces robustus]|uniref:Uncharacterized protein n=1 Tax=Anaeromyces robustus TaxID=1754192 RepID=A0A1Y1XLF4_9FUNG|nr:hypothetical protein BCR32DRAFT_324940 [Anaeromyces robustus]|eukprot:ORX86552.1 hypothetical protein BCR32DRAFT_324940 [Anaeromyces robustus]
MEDENGESMEAELHANTPSDSETLLNIVVDSNSNKPIKFNYNSAEIMTLLWYGNGELIRNGKCYNKDFTVLLLLSIITDLNREGKIELGKYNIYDKPLIFCIDKNAVGIPYYDFCLDLFKEKNCMPLHVFINKGVINGTHLRNLVIEDLEKKELVYREVKEIFNGKIKCNYWSVHMPLECQRWFRDYVFRDFKTDESIKNLVNLMIISSEVLYQKDRMFRNIFGQNEFYYIKKKFSSEDLEIPSIYVIGDDNNIKGKEFNEINNNNNINNNNTNKKPIDEGTEVTVGNDI